MDSSTVSSSPVDPLVDSASASTSPPEALAAVIPTPNSVLDESTMVGLPDASAGVMMHEDTIASEPMDVDQSAATASNHQSADSDDDLYVSDSEAVVINADSATSSAVSVDKATEPIAGQDASASSALAPDSKRTGDENVNEKMDADQPSDLSTHASLTQAQAGVTDAQFRADDTMQPMDTDFDHAKGEPGTVDVGDQRLSTTLDTDAPFDYSVPRTSSAQATDLDQPVVHHHADMAFKARENEARERDLVHKVKGLYRLLDIHSETGSGGNVDKIIIDQESSGRFINDLCPGAYKDLTEVDFRAMDRVNLKPLGVYGSKSEIISFFAELKVIDENTEMLLRKPLDTSGIMPALRPGLYALATPSDIGTERNAYIVFWPEETTWDDNAISAVRRNRTTFMRYLTKLTDQITVLISKEHGDKLMWDDPDLMFEDEVSPATFEDFDDSDRLFAFEVSKANEQEENVQLREGFIVKSQHIIQPKYSESVEVEPHKLRTRLVTGESNQALMTATYNASRQEMERIQEFPANEFQLRDLLFRNGAMLRLSKSLSPSAIQILIKNGLRDRYPLPVSSFEARQAETKKKVMSEKEAQLQSLTKELMSEEEKYASALETHFVKLVRKKFPKLDEATLRGKEAGTLPSKEAQAADGEFLQTRFAMNSDLARKLLADQPDSKFTEIKTDGKFTKAIRKVLICEHLFSHYELSSAEQEKIWKLVSKGVDSGDMKGAADYLKGDEDNDTSMPLRIITALYKTGRNLLSTAGTSSIPDGPVKDAREATKALRAVDFFDRIDRILEKWPLLAEDASAAVVIASDYFTKTIKDALRKTPHALLHAQTEYCKRQVEREIDAKLYKEQMDSLKQLLDELEDAYPSEADCPDMIILENLEVQESRGYYYGDRKDSYRCIGWRMVRTQPTVTYSLRPIELDEHDKQQMKTDTAHVPKPKLSLYSHSFHLPLDTELRCIQLISNNRCLLILGDRSQNIYIYSELVNNLKASIERNHHKKLFHKDKLGRDIVVAYDESKRMLVICGADAHKHSLQIHHFIFDEKFAALRGQGSPIELSHWYTEFPRIVAIHSLTGSDELALVEECGRIRVFSSVTQQFRPAVLQLHSSPAATYGTPDGSCLAAIFHEDGMLTLRVYHWTSLGCREGFSFDFPAFPDQIPSISALDDKKNGHVIWIDLQDNALRSTGIEIARQVTEFQFREKNAKNSSQRDDKRTVHNALLDCHSDVWTRFPVVPAVRRETITSGESRQDKALLFATSSICELPFLTYLKDMVEKFEKNTKKPTDSHLKSIMVRTKDMADLFSSVHQQDFWRIISTFKAGEWMVNFFCLIPIHIAITRDNRFIPLKDGVWSPEAEKHLLGASINQVVDSLSFGWYESIFQSYMSTKPVKVVSSMGEQSVGKSFALNHLADTSFAGSAMRTTEGVWMSVTPTDADLIVSLDFEGVHSIERSAQEDTLLVLFNAAISNLVLFRNNFALSREITNLFQSFQSSSSILDPEANPTLFQSTLVVIIKDVVDSDRVEIAREFKLKLNKIVQEEQGSNFITRLYRGRLNIMPWPVIESRQFYTLFSTLKRHLDNQESTHECGGKFLGKLKMLMAKLKTNDWGALSQNMTAHRAQQLLSLLPNALIYGATETVPDLEPLKNFDTYEVIDVPDTLAVYWLDNCGSKESKDEVLSKLLPLWTGFLDRCRRPEKSWISDLASYLEGMVELRVAHVQAWVDSNLAHSGATNTSIEDLRRTLDSKVVELKRNIQLCATQCERCLLQCVKTRFHDGSHDCTTDHSCPNSCQFLDEHEDEDAIDGCSLPAGHDGVHICNPTMHLCGQPCDLADRRGCQNSCTKVAHHGDSEHLCSSKRHYCRKNCSLQKIRTPEGGLYSCQGYCSIVWNEEHEKCVCDAMLTCPIPCQLCGRLCGVADHLHGLQDSAVHLCGQEHKCASLCSSTGVCEIDTVPQSIEATFSGAHDRFQYTKYSQVTKNLRCAIMIAPSEVKHNGPHMHSTADTVFHYCDVRCGNCGYVCTLPYGHSQVEHSTNHGSMSKTQWAIDGPTGAVFELDGHKFGSSDDGAPMLCNLVCSNMGCHVHIDYCRAQDVPSCNTPETDHIHHRVEPNPDRAKDWITHRLYWRRIGFKDPYSREEQTLFAKCDAMCSGPEHQATTSSAAHPSYCTLQVFHPRAAPNSAPTGGYISNDGHAFACKNPAVLSQAFHVIFVVDRSGSMTGGDRRPLVNHPAWNSIARVANNRLGAVYSALHSFWSARATAVNQSSGANRRDAYSVILFESSPAEVLSNDFTSTPDQLLTSVLAYAAGGGTDFNKALGAAERVMQRHWSTERTPIIIFLSDGECSVNDSVVYGLCRKAVSLGKALSFHAVSFGPDGSSVWLRRMVQIAQEIQNGAPRDPLLPANAVVESSYSIALDSVRLAETFLGLADSLRKTRGGLISH